MIILFNNQLNMKAADYKGKHFIIVDELDEYDSEDPYVDVVEILINDNKLRSHIIDCDFYGIPPYIGKDKELIKRITHIRKSLGIEEEV